MAQTLLHWQSGWKISLGQIVFAAAAACLLWLVAFPLGAMYWQSFRTSDGGLGFGNYIDFVQSDRLLRSTFNTVAVALAAAVGSILIATPLAFGIARTNMRGKGAVKLAVVLVFISPPFLSSLAYIAIAGPNSGYINLLLRDWLALDVNRGPINIFSLYGFALLVLPGTVAIVFLTLLPAFGNMDSALEEASRVAGASASETVWRISLPVMRAGILAGGLLAFSVALAEFATPYLLGIDVLTVIIRTSLLISFDFEEAATIACVSAALSILVLFLYRRTTRQEQRYQTISGRGYRSAQLQLGASRHLFTGLAWIYAVFGAFVPYTLLVLMSFTRTPSRGFASDNFTIDNYHYILTSGPVRSAFLNSLFLGVSSATIIGFLGFLLAYLVTRTATKGRSIIDFFSILPLGVAGTAFATGVIILYLETPMNALGVYSTIWILLITYVGRYIPYGMRTAQVSLMQVSRELEEAARVAGASQLRTIWDVTAPLIRTGIAYAWIFGFLQAFPEVSASAMLRGPDVDVASTALLNILGNTRGLALACAFSVVLLVPIISLVYLVQHIGGPKIIPRVT